jgi:ABC-2 type transport system permease protein
MAANATLQRVQEQGWRRGFANTLRKENRDWWGTRRWWIATLLWLLLANGTLAATLASSPDDASAVQAALAQFMQMTMLTTILGAITIMQNTLIDEKKTGTAEWILSKPVSRSAFILTKFLSNAIALLLIAIVLQGALAYLQLSTRAGAALAPASFVAGLGIIALQMLLFIALTLMVGAFFNSRGAVLGIPLGLVFMVMLSSNFVPSIVQIVPFTFGITTGPADPALAALAFQGEPLPTVLPLVAAAAWIVIFLAVAIRRFGREEF